MTSGRNTQVTTWPRYTAAEKKAYRARVARRFPFAIPRHHFADNFGSGVPTARVNGDVL